MKHSCLLIYLHGFHSSPYCEKSLLLQQACQRHQQVDFYAPQQACLPAANAQMLSEMITAAKAYQHVGLVGSSLGGYFSLWLHSLYLFPTVLVNPEVQAYQEIEPYLGWQEHPYTKERYYLSTKDITALKALDIGRYTHSAIWLLQQQGDEVLDYRKAKGILDGCKQTLEPGGDHSFTGFERYCDQIIKFLFPQ